MTEGLPSKPIPLPWQAPWPFGPSRETRITNPMPASHEPRQTTTAKESTTLPHAPRPTHPHRVTLATVTIAPNSLVPLWRTAMPCPRPDVHRVLCSTLGQRPITPTSAPAPDTFANQQSMAKPTHRAQSASDGLGRIASPAPLPPPVHKTRPGPTPIEPVPQNLPHLTEPAISSQEAIEIGEQTRFRPKTTRAMFQNVSKRFPQNQQTNPIQLRPCFKTFHNVARRERKPPNKPNPLALTLPGSANAGSRPHTRGFHIRASVPCCPKPVRYRNTAAVLPLLGSTEAALRMATPPRETW